jgi:sugar phosphate isomerase/epimerase
MKLAFSTLGCPAWNIETVAEAVVRYGYDAVEWRVVDGSILSPETPEHTLHRLVTLTREYHLSVAALDTSCQFVQADAAARERTVRDAQVMADLAATLGAPYLRVFGGNLAPGVSLAEALLPAAEAFARASTHASSISVRLLLETHDNVWSSSANALRFVQAAGVPEHAILWDLYHTCRAGEAPEQTLDQLGSALAYVHFKDARSSAARGWELVPPGEGTLPLARTIHLLKRRGYTGFLSFEWEKLWHPHLAEPEMVLPQASTLVRRCLQEKAEDSSVAFEEGI